MALTLKILAAAIILGMAFGAIAGASTYGSPTAQPQSASTAMFRSQVGSQETSAPMQDLSELSLALMIGLAVAASVSLAARRQTW
jgi:hypothetical protein